MGNEIWFLTDARLAHMPVTGGKPRTITANIRGRSGNAVMGTDGRYIYINFDSTGFGRGEIYQVDPNYLKHWALVFWAPVRNLDTIFSIELAADGQLLVMADGNPSGPDLHYVDSSTGKTTQMLTVNSAHNRAWRAIEDPKACDIIMLSTGKTERQASTWRNGKLLHAAPYGTKTAYLHGITVRRSAWLHRPGTVCLPSNQGHAFFPNSGPEVGNTKYALTLTRKGSAAGILLICINGQLKSPVSLSGLGMTGWMLGVLPLVPFSFFIPASGSLTLPLPIGLSLGRSSIDVQMVMTETGANAVNLITGQVGSILSADLQALSAEPRSAEKNVRHLSIYRRPFSASARSSR